MARKREALRANCVMINHGEMAERRGGIMSQVLTEMLDRVATPLSESMRFVSKVASKPEIRSLIPLDEMVSGCMLTAVTAEHVVKEMSRQAERGLDGIAALHAYKELDASFVRLQRVLDQCRDVMVQSQIHKVIPIEAELWQRIDQAVEIMKTSRQSVASVVQLLERPWKNVDPAAIPNPPAQGAAEVPGYTNAKEVLARLLERKS